MPSSCVERIKKKRRCILNARLLFQDYWLSIVVLVAISWSLKVWINCSCWRKRSSSLSPNFSLQAATFWSIENQRFDKKTLVFSQISHKSHSDCPARSRTPLPLPHWICFKVWSPLPPPPSHSLKFLLAPKFLHSPPFFFLSMLLMVWYPADSSFSQILCISRPNHLLSTVQYLSKKRT